MGAVLSAFAKHLFDSKGAIRFPNVFVGKQVAYLHVGACRIASWSRLASAKQEQQSRDELSNLGFRREIQTRPTFHPYCSKTFSQDMLKAVLPKADIVCLTCASTGGIQKDLFRKEELTQMKEDSILIVIGSHDVVNAEDLAVVAETGMFRGILFDAIHRPPIPLKSPLWNIPDIVITPDVSSRPRSPGRQSFQVFHYNMRQYMHGNFGSMRNRVDTDRTLHNI